MIKIKNVVIISFMFYLISCAPLYVPNKINTPLLSQKNEASVDFSYGESGVNLQSSYAITNNIGVMLNGAYLSQENNYDEKNERSYLRKSKFAETAVGYFNNFSGNSVAEIYFGGGLGKASSIDNYMLIGEEKIYSEGNYYKLFLQTNIGIKGKFVEGGVALRTSYINFTKFHYENLDLKMYPESYFFEPSVFVRFGGPIFKFQSQLGFASKLSNKEFVTYNPLILSVGILFRINTNLNP